MEPNRVQESKFPSAYFYILMSAAFAGVLDAAYLTYEKFYGGGIVCVLARGCDVVTTSRYSEIFRVPVSFFGLLFYITVFTLALIMTDRKRAIGFTLLLALSASAFVSSLALVYIQLFILNAICIYCVGSAVTSTIIFFFSLLARRRLKVLTDPV